MKKRKSKAFGLCAAVLALAGVITLDSMYRLVVTEYSLSFSNLPNGFDGLRIVQLSDLHGMRFGRDNCRLVEKVRALRPDLIVLTGDFIDLNRERDLAVVETLCSQLVELAPVYFCSGNHDWSSHKISALSEVLNRCGVRVGAHLLSVGSVFDRAFDPVVPELSVAASPLPVLDEAVIDAMQQAIADAKADGDSIGGIIECAVTGFPKGHGTPLFDGIDSRLSSLLFAVPAVRAVSFGSGFNAAAMRGSAHNDAYCLSDGEVRTETNWHGGLIGGISTGMPILFTVAIKPAASIRKPQQALHLPSGEQTTLTVSGRHDACIAVRAVPVIEAAAALALYDVLLEESHAE